MSSRFINVQAKVNSAGPARAGFGVDLILSHLANSHADFHERARVYTQVADAVADSFPADGPECLALAKIFSATPRPQFALIGRAESQVTQKYTIGAAVLRNLSKYKLNVSGQGVTTTLATYVSLASATLEAIHAGMVAALNAVVGKNFTAAFAALPAFVDFNFTADSSTDEIHAVAHGLKTGDGPVRVSNAGGGLPTGLLAATDYWVIKVDADNIKLATSQANAIAGTAINVTTNGTGTQTLDHTVAMFRPSDPFTVTVNAANDWFSIGSPDIAAFDIAQTHAAPSGTTLADDLAAIAESVGSDTALDFYRVDTLYNSQAYVLDVGDWVEDNGRTYVVDTQDSDSARTAHDTGGGDTDTLGVILARDYKRVMHSFHPRPAAFYSAGLNGILLPLNPGLWTAAYKQPQGVEGANLTPTMIANIEARRAGSISADGGATFSWNGMVPNEDYGFFDITVSVDWMVDALQKAALGIFLAKLKVGYTDEDIDAIAARWRGVILEAISDTHKMIARGTPGNPNDPVPIVSFPRVADIDPSVRKLRKLPNGQVSCRFVGAVQSVDALITISF